jgi:catechol 2,3-dioxygenase
MHDCCAVWWLLLLHRGGLGFLTDDQAPIPSYRSVMMPQPTALPATLPSDTMIGHVHLKVADLDRALAFYSGVLGFEVQQRYGDQAVFLGAGGYHHHIALNTWESRGAAPAPPGHPGLYHTAILLPDRASLAATVKRVLAAGITLDGAADHGVSEAVYLRDPDGNGVELYRDRPRAEWPRDALGALQMGNWRLDMAALLAEAD